MKLLLIPALCLATLMTIKLEKRSLLQDNIEVLVPTHFVPMSAEMLALKYPTGPNTPSVVLTDEDGTVNIAISHISNQATPDIIEAYQKSIKTSFRTSHPKAIWKGEGVKLLNGRKIGYLKVITQGRDQPVYNYLLLTDLKGRLLIFTFNCTEKLLPEWEPTAEKIISSFRVKDV